MRDIAKYAECHFVKIWELSFIIYYYFFLFFLLFLNKKTTNQTPGCAKKGGGHFSELSVDIHTSADNALSVIHRDDAGFSDYPWPTLIEILEFDDYTHQ